RDPMAAVGSRPLAGCDDSVEDVVDEGVVASAVRFSVAVEGHDLAVPDETCELVHRHFRSLSRTVNRKEAEGGGADAKELAVIGEVQLRGAFGCGVRGTRTNRRIGLAKWNVGAGAVHRRRGGEDEALYPKMAARFEEIQRAFDVDPLVS